MLRSSLYTILALGAAAVSGLHAFTDSTAMDPFWWYPEKSHVEGIAFYAYRSDRGNGTPPGLTRFYEAYNSISKECFYTTSDAELASLKIPRGVSVNYKGWLDGTFRQFYIFPGPQPGLSPLWRSFNGKEHLYSLNQQEGLDVGYHIEGIAGCVYGGPHDGAEPIYRWLKD